VSADLPMSAVQSTLLHEALRNIERAKDQLKSMRLLQRYGGQPKLLRTTEEMEKALQNVWHMLDGLDRPKQG